MTVVLLTDSKASSGNKKSSHPQSYEKNKLKAPEPKKKYGKQSVSTEGELQTDLSFNFTHCRLNAPALNDITRGSNMIQSSTREIFNDHSLHL